MRSRWRGRSAVLAIALLATVVSAAAVAAVAGSRAALRVSLPNGETLAILPLPPGGEITLRYRNSLYGTLAAERFDVTDDGRLRLVGLEAEQVAVLEEYYAVTDAPRETDGGLGHAATPAHAPVIQSLRVAATDRGERTLIIDGHHPIELWRFVDDDSPSVILAMMR